LLVLKKIPQSAEVKYTPFQRGVLNFMALYSYGRAKSYPIKGHLTSALAGKVFYSLYITTKYKMNKSY